MTELKIDLSKVEVLKHLTTQEFLNISRLYIDELDTYMEKVFENEKATKEFYQILENISQNDEDLRKYLAKFGDCEQTAENLDDIIISNIFDSTEDVKEFLDLLGSKIYSKDKRYSKLNDLFTLSV